jgi:hypothetical protein
MASKSLNTKIEAISMQPDYPAAHSMDTMFFAVDKDGNVAVFNTGEAGAVPTRALAAEQAEDVQRQLLSDLPRCEIIHDVDGQDPAQRRQPDGGIPLPFTGLQYPVLMFLTSLDPVQADIAAGQAFPVRANAGAAVVWRTLSEARYRDLAAAGVCVSWAYFFGLDDEAGTLPPESIGLFLYSHRTENWISGPYDRRQIPATPLHVDQLPPRLRKIVQSFTFESLSFHEAHEIQPMEHTECESWEAAWLDLQKNIRCIPGREAEYAERYAEMAVGGEYKIEPPRE